MVRELASFVAEREQRWARLHRGAVQKPVLVGRDALDNRSMLDLRRPLERGVIREGSERDEEAAVLDRLRPG